MKNIIKSLVTIVAVTAMVGAYGQGTKKKAPAAKTMTCPYCKMKMTTTKSKAAPVAVKIKGTTYYCCAGCHKAPATTKKK